MPISVLATRCRHCGEEVGRPRKEEHKFTMRDLGGDQKTSYTVSGNVMDALELFRAEQLAAQEAARKDREGTGSTWFGKRPVPESTPSDPMISGLPPLDANSLDLAGLSSSPSKTAVPSRNYSKYGPTPAEIAMRVGGGIAAVIMVLMLGWFGWNQYQDYQERQELLRNPPRVSRALDMIAAGRPTLDALEEAIDAVRITESPENKEALETVRAKFIQEITALLDTNPFTHERLDEASRLVARAAIKDGSPAIQELQRQVNQEMDAYKLVLVKIDAVHAKAVFKVHGSRPDNDGVEVGVGDYVADRFIVQSVLPAQVRLLDTKRKSLSGQRSLIARIAQQVSGE